MIEATTERLSKDGERNSLTLIPVSSFILYFNVCNVVSFQYEKNCLWSHIVLLHALQKASNILVILHSKYLNFERIFRKMVKWRPDRMPLNVFVSII